VWTIEELISEMNVSNGNLVSSIACDDAADAHRVMAEPRAFKTGWNTVRSRGDRDEVLEVSVSPGRAASSAVRIWCRQSPRTA
jgi:hypothetical protein